MNFDNGCFIALKPDAVSIAKIYAYALGVGFTNLIPASELHTTIGYTKKPLLHPYPLITDKFSEPAKVYQLAYIGNAIALLLISKFVRQRNAVASICGLRSNFTSIIPHLSIVYDPPKGIMLPELPKPNFIIHFNKEIIKPPKDN